MFRILTSRAQQGHRTAPYPHVPPSLPERFRGLPVVDRQLCAEECGACVEACPTGALKAGAAGEWSVDLGRCLFCGDCAQACPKSAISYTSDHSLAARRREELVIDAAHPHPAVAALDERMRSLFGRSLKLRQVSAGGCNACESDVNVLGTIVFDLGRFGIQFVASPRHADGLLVTGPVSENMRSALMKTYDAVPPPKLVIAVGACAIAGGPYLGHDEVHDGADKLLPVDLYVPGCPPHPYTVLDGLLRLLGRLPDQSAQAVVEKRSRFMRFLDAVREDHVDEKVLFGMQRAEGAVRMFGADLRMGPTDRKTKG